MCRKTNRNNAILRVFYDKLNSRVFIEEPAYPFSRLLADVGGIFGIMLGASVLTFGEFAYAGIDLVLHWVSAQTLSIMA